MHAANTAKQNNLAALLDHIMLLALTCLKIQNVIGRKQDSFSCNYLFQRSSSIFTPLSTSENTSASSSLSLGHRAEGKNMKLASKSGYVPQITYHFIVSYHFIDGIYPDLSEELFRSADYLREIKQHRQ
jgi:hypothetical protein